MNTLRELQAIGDSEFETLVTWYLRRRDAQLAGLIATGVNEEGKPIPCPVDDILYMPGNPPRCVAVASTTTSRSKLRGKWLGTKADKGDIERAAKELQEWDLAEPQVVCTLYLATNRLLKSDVKLYRDAIETGRASNIEVQIVEASQLVNFLDHDPEGQYLREELLGIEAGRLSESLLRKIALFSLSLHRCTFAIGQGRQGKEIIRDAHSRLASALEESTASLVGLRGASGTGKSTLLQQVGKEINAKGGIALWVPAEEIMPGTSIANLFLKVLRRFHPSLNTRAGEDAIRLASLIPGGLVLLVDDVNRLPAPHQTLHAISSWKALASEGETSRLHGSRSWLRFVVPLWPGQLATSSKSLSEESSKWEFVELHPYSPRERAELARILSDSHPEEVRQVIDALNGDPFLCGLAPADVSVPVGISRSALVRKIFDGVLLQATNEAAHTRRIEATSNEFVTAVDELIKLMIQTEEPEPKWDQVRSALGDRRADLLHVLGKTNRLGWIESRDGWEIWRWKHDRLRDALVGRWLANNALLRAVQGDDADEIRARLSDPGLAEAWALALVFLPNADAQAKALTLLAEHQPLALAEMLRLNLFPNESNLRQRIAEGLVQALAGFDERARRFVGSPQRWILEKLSQTNDPLVLEMTKGMHQGRYIWAARFRNGDILAGLEWISRDGQGDFLPGVGYSFLEQSIEAFSLLFDRKGNHVADKLVQAIGQPKLSAAAMTLAGYLAWPELSWPVWNAWNTLPDDKKLATLVPIVWAISRCGDKSIQPKLEEALLLARELSDEERVEGKAHHASDRYWQFMEPLRHTRRWPITSPSAETWAKVAVEHPDLRETMCYVLRGIDHPATMEVYIRWSPEKGFMPWDVTFRPIDPLAEPDRTTRVPTNPAARDRLWEIIETESDQRTREKALSFWERSATVADLDRLRSVSSSDPLFDEVLQIRLKLRDKMATELLIAKMQSEPGPWCRYAPLLYSEAGVSETLLENLETALSSPFWRPYAIARHLPADGVRELVKRKQDLLLRFPRTWLALWQSDVPEALVFVQKAVSQAEPKDLQYFFFGDRFPFPVSRRMLDALNPILEYFPASERERLARLAVQNGFIDWVQEHLLDIALENHLWMTTDDVLSILTEAAKVVPKGAQHVLKNTEIFGLELRLRDKGGLLIDVIEILRTWLASSSDGNRLTIAAMLVTAFGTSSEISWWQDIEPEGEPAHTAWSNALYVLKRRRWHG